MSKRSAVRLTKGEQAERNAKAIETLRKAIFSAASLLQDDPNVSEDTWDFLEADVRCAANALDDIWFPEEP